MGLKIVLDTKEASRNADEFAKAIARVAQATGLAGKSADELMAKTASMSRRFGRIGGSAEKAAASVSRMGVGMDKASRGADKFSKSAGRASATSGKLAQNVKRLAASFIGFQAVSASVRTLAELEQGIVTLGTVTGKTGRELEVLQETAVRVAQATKFTPTETTQALLELSRAGQSAAVASESLIDVSNLAAAGVLGLGQAAGLVASSMAQFRDQTLNAEDVASTFVAVADRTKSTVTTLGSAMSQAGQAAAGFGISLDQTVVAVGTLQTAGIQASRTGRALKTILGSLATADKTSRGQSALKRLGLEAEEVTAQGGDLIGMLKRIGGALDGITSDRERVGILTTLVGKDFFSILQSMTDGVEDMEDLIDNLGDKQAELAEKAAKQNDTLSGSILNVTSAFQEMVLVAGGGGATGSLKSFFNTIAGSLRVLGGVEGGLDRASNAAKTLASVIKGVAIAAAIRGISAAVLLASRSFMSMKASMLGVASANSAIAKTSPWAAVTVLITAASFAIDRFAIKQTEAARRANAQRKQLAQDRRDEIDATAGEITGARSGNEKSREALRAKLENLRDRTSQRGAAIESKTFATRLGESGLFGKEQREAFNPNSEQALQLKEQLESITDPKIVGQKIADAVRELLDPQRVTDRLSPQEQRNRFAPGRESRVGAAERDQVQVINEALNNGALFKLLDQAVKTFDKTVVKPLPSRAGDGKFVLTDEQQAATNDLQTSINEISLSKLKDKFKDLVKREVDSGVQSVGESEIEGEIINLRLRNIELSKKGELDSKEKALIIERLQAEQEFASEKLRASIIAKNIADNEREAKRDQKLFNAALADSAKDLQSGIDKQAKSQEKLNDLVEEFNRLRGLSTLSEDNRAQEEARFDISSKIKDLGGSDDLADRLGAQAAADVGAQQIAEAESETRKRELKVAASEFESNRQALESVGATFGNSLGQALLSIADGATKAREAFTNMSKAIISQLIQMQLTKGFSNLFGLLAGGGDAGGGLGRSFASSGPSSADYLQRGGVIPAQQGRIIASPTTISRGGRSYSVSEGGGSTPEAVFPLTKDSRGRLAVSGSGGGGNSYSFSFPGIRNSQDAKAAKRTIGQSVAAVISASENKKNRMGMRPKSK